MKKPRKSPSINDIANSFKHDSQRISLALEEGRKTESEGKYRHWDVLRYLTPPSGLTHEEWWFGIKVNRFAFRKLIPLKDREGRPFSFGIYDGILEQLHEIDLRAGGTIAAPEEVLNENTRDQYIMRSLMQDTGRGAI